MYPHYVKENCILTTAEKKTETLGAYLQKFSWIIRKRERMEIIKHYLLQHMMLYFSNIVDILTFCNKIDILRIEVFKLIMF